MKPLKPEFGQIVACRFVWPHDAVKSLRQNIDPLRKLRPCVIMDVAGDASAPRVTVVPITTSLPRDFSCTVEIPAGFKSYKGLTHKRSWADCSSGFNSFQWPGYHIEPLGGQINLGTVPPKTLRKISDIFERSSAPLISLDKLDARLEQIEKTAHHASYRLQR